MPDTSISDKDHATVRNTAGFLPRSFPTLFFYPGMLRVVLQAASKAKRGRYTDEEWIKSSIAIVKQLEAVGGQVQVENVDVLNSVPTPCVFIGNHMSTLETFVLPSIIHPHVRITFVVKQSLVEYPVFKHVMRSVHPIVVQRKNPREDFRTVMEEGEKKLGKGLSLVIFPQSTRSVRFDPKGFNSMGIKLAKRTGVPVVPLALKTDAWANGKLLKDFGKIYPERSVHISFSEPLRVTGNGKQEHEKVVRFIQDQLRSWNQEQGAA